MRHRFVKAALLLAALLLASGVVFGLSRWEQGNLAEVSPGKVYRSRQLDAGELAAVIRRFGVKSILNLRGHNQGDRWYQDEALIADALGVRLYSVALSAHRDVDSSQVADLLSLLHALPLPILIHCKSGADRTGLVSALYLYEVEGTSLEEAAGQLSLFYLHLPPILGAASSAMDRTLHRVARMGDAIDLGSLAIRQEVAGVRW